MILPSCTGCQKPYPEEGVPYKCPRCGGIYDYITWPVFDRDKVELDLMGIWRYRHTLNLPANSPVITLGEGNTPLVWAKAFKKKVAFKLEYLNPTGSFKDRGTSVLLTFLKTRGVDHAVEDSSGNAGASFAAYAARAGIRAGVFVPDSASGPKRAQIEAYGANLTRILGKRSNTAQAVQRVAGPGVVYASHTYLPHVLLGLATLAYELVEQLNDAPGTVIAPVGQGSLLLGMGRGFQALKQAGVISQFPMLVGVQAMVCAPLWALFEYGPTGLGWVIEGETLAEGIRIKNPVRGDSVFHLVEANGGQFLAVDEEQILTGRNQLARLGFYVEPTSAVVWSALEQVVDKVPEPIAVILTGSGFKSDR